MKKMLFAAAAATAFVATAAFASVTFDNTTGTGFVGKGDIQILYGWNNAQLQRNAGGVVFSYDATDTYDVTCEWDTGVHNIVHHSVTHPTHTSVSSSIAYDPRQIKGQKQFTGFNLNGFGLTTSQGSVPAVGDSCPNGNSGIITAADLVSSEGGLNVTYGGITYPLPNTPVL
jgi:hypothetical protein